MVNQETALTSRDQAVEALIQALGTGNEVHRCFAAQALGKIGDKRAVQPLMDHVQDMDLDVALDSIEALGLLGDPAALPLLTEGFNLADVPDIKINAAAAMGCLGGENIVDEMIKALRIDLDMTDDTGWDASWDINHIAVESLGRIGDARAIAPLTSMLDDDTVVEDEGNILRALAGCGEDGISVVTSRLHEHNSARARRRSAMALSDSTSALARDALAEALLDDDGDVRIYAARTLAGFNDNAYLLPLLMLLKDQNEEVRREAVQLVTGFSGDRAVERLLLLLEDEDTSVRIAAARALGEQQINDAAGPLIDLLQHQDMKLRQTVVEALGEIGDEHARAGLLAVLASETEDELVRSVVPAALVRMADDNVIAALRDAVGDDSHVVRSRTMIALRDINSSQSRDVLLAALRGELLTPSPVEEEEAGTEEAIADEVAVGEAGIEEQASEADKLSAGDEDEADEGVQSTLDVIEHDNLKAEQSAAGSMEDVIDEDLPEEVQEFVGIAKKNWKQIQSLKPQKTAPYLDVRHFAARALSGCAGDDVVDALCVSLESKDTDLQEDAVKSLGSIGDTRAIPLLLPLVDCENQRLRFMVTRSLGQMRAEEVRETLLAQLDDEDHFVRLAAAETLVYFRGEDIRSALRERLLRDEELGVRLACARSLATIGNEDDVEAIVQAAFLDDGEQRLEMGAILRDFYKDRATSQLIDILNDQEQEYYHRIAIEALQEVHRSAEMV
jgi:HEAT repeat protein